MNVGTIISAIIVPLSVYIVFSLIRKSIIKNNENFTDEKFTVRIPKMVRDIGMFGYVISLAIIICITFFTDELTDLKSYVIFYGIFGLLIFACIYLIYKTVRFRVDVNGSEVTVYPLFGKMYSFTFSEISSAVRQVKNTYQSTSERIIVKTNSGKKFIVESTEIAYDRFAKRIKAKVKNEVLSGF